MRSKTTFWCAAAAAIVLALPSQRAAQAQDYPSKPVTFVTPAAAGNSPDVVTRVVADRLTALWKQQVVVINRPGAGGLIAAQAAAQLPKDGYSIYMTQASTYTVLPIQQGAKMPVDLHKSFTPVGMVGEQPIAIGVQKDIKANNVAELVKLANSTQGGMLFAATNRGGWRREHRAATSACWVSPPKSACPTCRTCRPLARRCRALYRAAGS